MSGQLMHASQAVNREIQRLYWRGQILGRSRKQIERLVTHPDLDYELAWAAATSWVQDPRTGRSLRMPTISGGSGAGLGTYAECIYSNPTVGTAKNTFTTEFAINDTAGMGPQPVLPAFYFSPQAGLNKSVRIVGRVVQLGTGSTPPTWQVIHRWNPVVTPANPPTGPNIGGMPAGVTGTTTTNTLWESELDTQLTLFGAPGNNSTIRGLGMVFAPTGFVSPFSAQLFGGGASPGTVATFDFSLLNTLTYGVVCGTSLAANQVQLLQLIVIGLN
jgi:hypothetical protein